MGKSQKSDRGMVKQTEAKTKILCFYFITQTNFGTIDSDNDKESH
ncbi:hypothetical protein [Aliivibrio kagoshimensis]